MEDKSSLGICPGDGILLGPALRERAASLCVGNNLRPTKNVKTMLLICRACGQAVGHRVRLAPNECSWRLHGLLLVSKRIR